MFDKADGCHIHLQPPHPHPQHTLDHTAAHSPSKHFSLLTKKILFLNMVLKGQYKYKFQVTLHF